MILGEIFERNARCFGSHPAVLFEGRSLSHRELASRIRRLINALAEIGCKKQDRIAVLSRNCPEYLEIYGAAALAGFIGAGINYRLSLAEQIDILKDVEPSVLVFEPEYAQNTEKIRAALPPSS